MRSMLESVKPFEFLHVCIISHCSYSCLNTQNWLESIRPLLYYTCSHLDTLCNSYSYSTVKDIHYLHSPTCTLILYLCLYIIIYSFWFWNFYLMKHHIKSEPQMLTLKQRYWLYNNKSGMQRYMRKKNLIFK